MMQLLWNAALFMRQLQLVDLRYNHLEDLPVGLGWLVLKASPASFLASHNPLSELREDGFGTVPLLDDGLSQESSDTILTMSSANVAEAVDQNVRGCF